MALNAGDLLLLDRSGLKTCQIGDLAAKMQDSDLVMLDQGSGLRKATWGQRSSFNSSDLFTVGRGSSIYKTTWGAIQGLMTIEAEIISANNETSTNETVTLDDLFTSAQLASTQAKVITIQSGAVVGSTNTGVPALSILSGNPVNGTVTVINNGSILGAGGAGGSANAGIGGNGGTAFSTSMNVTLINNSGGQIFGGGGAGGGGGKGGNGSTSSNVFQGKGECVPNDACFNGGSKGEKSSCETNYGNGAYCNTSCEPCVLVLGNSVCNTCYKTITSTTYGGDGGTGGNATGYKQAPTSGQSGASGGTNAGNGGDGATWGTNGQAGGSGTNGNSTNGVIGGAGGFGGASTQANGNTITLTNNGNLNGPQI